MFSVPFCEKTLAETVPANTLTNIAYQKQSGGIIFVLKARHNSVRYLIGRVEPAPVIEFLYVGDYNFAYGVVWSIPVNKGQVIVVGAEMKFICYLFQLCALQLA